MALGSSRDRAADGELRDARHRFHPRRCGRSAADGASVMGADSLSLRQSVTLSPFFARPIARRPRMDQTMNIPPATIEVLQFMPFQQNGLLRE